MATDKIIVSNLKKKLSNLTWKKKADMYELK